MTRCWNTLLFKGQRNEEEPATEPRQHSQRWEEDNQAKVLC